MPATLEQLLSVYRGILMAEFFWAKNPAKLDAYIEKARTQPPGFKANGFCLLKAWKACGMVPPVTLEKMKGLSK